MLTHRPLKPLHGQNRVEELVVLRSRRLRIVRLVHVCFGPWLRIGLGFILGRLRCAAAFAAFEKTGAVRLGLLQQRLVVCVVARERLLQPKPALADLLRWEL